MQPGRIILIMALIGVAYLFKDLRKVIVIEYKEHVVEEKIADILSDKYPGYRSGAFWKMQSINVGSYEPPYSIVHIYSEGGDSFKYSKFHIDSALRIGEEEHAKLIQHKYPVDSLSVWEFEVNEAIYLMQARERLADNAPYEAIIILQELLQLDSSSTEAASLLHETLGALN